MSHHIDIVQADGGEQTTELFPDTPRVGDVIELGAMPYEYEVIEVTWRTTTRVHKPTELEWRPAVIVARR